MNEWPQAFILLIIMLLICTSIYIYRCYVFYITVDPMRRKFGFICSRSALESSPCERDIHHKFAVALHHL